MRAGLCSVLSAEGSDDAREPLQRRAAGRDVDGNGVEGTAGSVGGRLKWGGVNGVVGVKRGCAWYRVLSLAEWSGGEGVHGEGVNGSARSVGGGL